MGSSASSGSCMHQSILFATKISTNSHVKIPTGLESLNTFEVALHCRSFSRQCITLCKLRRHRPQIEKVGTDSSQRGNQRLQVTMARNCRFPDLETCGSQPGNQRLPLQGIAGSQKLAFMCSKLSGYHCKELRVPKA